MVKKTIIVLATLLLILSRQVSAQYAEVGKSVSGNDVATELAIEYVVPSGDIYERQPFPIFVVLKSAVPDVATAECLNDFKLDKGSFSTFQTIDNPGNPYTKKDGKKTYYYFPIKAYMASIADKGSYKLKGGDYKIGVAYPVVVNDPFWGQIRTQQVKEQEVAAEDAKIKVKSLPPVSPGTNFSGSVGDFSIETIVPPGDIFLNEEATAYVVLRGKGMIEKATLPEYRRAFGTGLKLKSVAESRVEQFDPNDNEMISEIHLECTFEPTEMDNVEIGEITFGYFDPASKQYKTARSKPVQIKVKSTVSKHESLSI